MGCTSSRDGTIGLCSRTNIQSANDHNNMLISRILDYQKQSREYLNDLMLEPKSLVPEELRFGYISTTTFFNMFHSGFCGPYIANPKYMLLVDFRSYEEYEQSHIHSAIHFSEISWENVNCHDFLSYSLLVFYDFDGTSAANIFSVLFRAKQRLKRVSVSMVDALVILGGLNNVEERFPHTIYQRSSLRTAVIPWMPNLIKTEHLFLGRYEQAEEKSVILGLGITHVLSIGRSPERCFQGVLYHGLDGERDIEETFHTSFRLISDVITQLDQACVNALQKYERELFGYGVTDLDEMIWII
eukprot:maker-scaffold462_size163801-snap-gene-0.54 protein:Tk04571 transcript:maker-scaffold462_size163801-snap-gene-0.54-mRNA-1 annotation:"dual specificity protein phosphatase 1-like"